MKARPTLLTLVLCVGCGAAADEARSSIASTDAAVHGDTSATEQTTNSTGADGTTTSLAENRVSYVPVGPSRAAQPPKEALAQTVAGLSHVIRSATLGPKPSDLPGTDGVWLHIEVTADGRPPVQVMEGDWEAALLVSAVADRTAVDGHLASVIKGSIVDYVPSDVTGAPGGQPTNDSIVAGQEFQPPGDDHEIERVATDTLAQFSVHPVSIEVLHPLDAALKVVATVDTPEAMNGRLAELQSVLTGTPIHYEGVYLEVRLPDGSPIAVLATSFRAGRGSQWVRPDLEEILGGPPHA